MKDEKEVKHNKLEEKKEKMAKKMLIKGKGNKKEILEQIEKSK